MLFVINTIRVKLLVGLPPNPLGSGAAFHAHFDTHLIRPNKGFPIINSEMCMTFGKLEAPLPVEFLEEGSISGYAMIIAKAFEGNFELGYADVKLEVPRND
jgi:hypothetical protein